LTVFLRLGLLVSLPIMLAACAASDYVQATPQEVAAAAYRPDAPPSMTLITVVNNTTGAGGHTALLVTGSQQVLFDPAGSFRDDRVKVRGDVIYGMTPSWVAAYKSAHARASHHVVSQTLPLSQQQAETALQLVQSNGAVGPAYCTNSTSSLIRQIPGFEDIQTTFYPVKLMDQIAGRGDVVTDRHYENDAGGVVDGIAAAQL